MESFTQQMPILSSNQHWWRNGSYYHY